MRFFKHFVDSHRGKSLLRLKRELGMAGVGMYWTLIEACAEKLEKGRDELYSKDHCIFEFDRDHVVQLLGTKRTRVDQVLARFQEAGLLLAESRDNVIKIIMPKLLECLDRDSNRARTERAMDAPKIKNKRKRKKEDKEIEIAPAAPVLVSVDRPTLFEQTSELYRKTFPGTTTGPNAKKRWIEQVKTIEAGEAIRASIPHYQIFLAHESNAWRKPKTSFETFLGTKSSGYFWHDFKDPPDLPASTTNMPNLDHIAWDPPDVPA